MDDPPESQPDAAHESGASGAHHSRKAVLVALMANAGVTVAKVIAAIVTGSAGLLAESMHSFADTGNQGLLLVGQHRSQKPPSARHHFGGGREQYVWSFVVAMVLFSLGGAFAIYEGVHKLSNPHELERVPVALVVLVIALVAEGLSLRTAVRSGRAMKGRSTWRTFIRESKSPEILVVLLEDLGALIGLLIALCMTLLSVTTGDPRYDAVGSLLIGVLLIVISTTLVIETKSLLVGEAVSDEDRKLIESTVAETPGVERVIFLMTEHRAAEDVMVGVKVDLDGDPGQAETAAIIDAIEARVRQAVPRVQAIFVEVDIWQERHVGRLSRPRTRA